MFLDFARREALYGTRAAVRSYELENYTARRLVEIIRGDVGLEEEVDLVEGRHVTVFFTEAEEEAAKRDWEAAKAAGLERLEEVRWIGREEMKRVRCVPPPLALCL